MISKENSFLFNLSNLITYIRNAFFFQSGSFVCDVTVTSLKSNNGLYVDYFQNEDFSHTVRTKETNSLALPFRGEDEKCP